jgi:hypothetical protein
MAERGRESLFSRRLYVAWFPLHWECGRPRYNRWWWHNLHCRSAWIYRLHYGQWPTYWYWRRGIDAPCDGGFACSARTHIHGCFSDYGNCDEPGEYHGGPA